MWTNCLMYFIKIFISELGDCMDRIHDLSEPTYRKRCILIITFSKNSVISYVRNYASCFYVALIKHHN